MAAADDGIAGDLANIGDGDCLTAHLFVANRMSGMENILFV
jgi:hypothetical protein